MLLPFQKYHGAGNDFIMIDNRMGQFDGENSSLIQDMCDRRFGIGADGLILISSHKELDFSMRYFNADGNEANMCGNGGRCAVAYAKKLMLISSMKTRFRALDGFHDATIEEDVIRLKMLDVNNVKLLNKGYFLNTGVPHVVRFVNNLDRIDVWAEGREIRYSKEFGSEGTNVNFVEVKNDLIYIRTYERGVENETYACGTGSIAAALSVYIHLRKSDIYEIVTKGGRLKVSFNEGPKDTFHDIWLEGPAQFVFEGEYSNFTKY